MRIRPIPKRLLIHSVTHKTLPTKDQWGTVSWGTSQAVSFVRVEPTSKVIISKDSKQVQLSALMLYDSVNSIPTDINFTVQDAIVYDGVEYIIMVVDKINDDTGLHHLEVGMQ